MIRYLLTEICATLHLFMRRYISGVNTTGLGQDEAAQLYRQVGRGLGEDCR